MAMQATQLRYVGPLNRISTFTNPSYSGGFTTFNAAGNIVYSVFRATKACTIDRIWGRTGATVTVGGDVDVGIYAVDQTTGQPNLSSQIGSTVTVSMTAASSWYLSNAGLGAAVAFGQEFAIVFTHKGNSVDLTLLLTQAAGLGVGCYPYGGTLVAAGPTWAKANLSAATIGIVCDDGSGMPEPNIVPGTAGYESFSSNTNPDGRGARWRPASKDRVIGFEGPLANSNGGGAFTISFCDDSLNVLNGVNGTPMVITADVDVDLGSNQRVRTYFFPDAYVPTPGTYYRVVVDAITTTAIDILVLTAVSAALAQSFCKDWHYFTRNDGGTTPTDYTSKSPIFQLITDQGDDGTGGGSTIVRKRSMFNIPMERTAASNPIVEVYLEDASGNPVTGLTNASAGLKITAQRERAAAVTAYTGSDIETISTIGTYAAPSTNKVRFKEIDATNRPGWYQIMLAQAVTGTADDSRWVAGNAVATGAKLYEFKIDLLLPIALNGSQQPVVEVASLSTGAKSEVRTEASAAITTYGTATETTAAAAVAAAAAAAEDASDAADDAAAANAKLPDLAAGAVVNANVTQVIGETLTLNGSGTQNIGGA